MQELPGTKQYNPGRVRNFPLNFQATVRNKPGAQFSRAKNSRCKIPPPLYDFPSLSLQAAQRSAFNKHDPFEGYEDVLRPHLDLEFLKRGNVVPTASKL